MFASLMTTPGITMIVCASSGLSMIVWLLGKAKG